jgi:hypothetical protein
MQMLGNLESQRKQAESFHPVELKKFLLFLDEVQLISQKQQINASTVSSTTEMRIRRQQILARVPRSR